jgi:hypothetical protein
MPPCDQFPLSTYNLQHALLNTFLDTTPIVSVRYQRQSTTPLSPEPSHSPEQPTRCPADLCAVIATTTEWYHGTVPTAAKTLTGHGTPARRAATPDGTMVSDVPFARHTALPAKPLPCLGWELVQRARDGVEALPRDWLRACQVYLV